MITIFVLISGTLLVSRTFLIFNRILVPIPILIPILILILILIQIPVFFGFFTMLRSAVELRGAQFLWACDLSQSDTIAHVAGFPINPLPMIMGVTMILQARMTPVSPTADPMQQKIMKYMPLMFIVILYNFSAGLTLYWTVQNMLSILQTKLTKNIVVEAPAKSSDSPLAKQPRGKSKKKKKSKPKS